MGPIKKMHVVIIGGGFAGLRAAKTLARHQEVFITLIDQHNYHLFQPLLYQVATAGLSPADIAVPIRSIVGSAPNIEVILGKVNVVNPVNKKIFFDSGKELRYGFLILAAGARHSYFSHPEWEPLAPGLKTLEQATEIRRRVLLAYERAEIETDPVRRKSLLTFVIVGGGPTGVELAGAIAEISRKTLSKDFKNIDPSQARIVLIEATNRILGAFSENLSRKAAHDLEAMGVQIWTQCRVSRITPISVEFTNESLATETVIWAAGVEPSPLGQQLDWERDAVGRVLVTDTLNLPGHQEIFVVGDLAHFKTSDGKILPGLAPIAIQQGESAAKNILRQLRGQPMKPFHYFDKGMMATIGRKKAIMEFHGFQASGLLAWLAWLLIHIFYLVDFKNKVFVFLNWCWSYITFRKGARLILDPTNLQNSSPDIGNGRR